MHALINESPATWFDYGNTTGEGVLRHAALLFPQDCQFEAETQKAQNVEVP